MTRDMQRYLYINHLEFHNYTTGPIWTLVLLILSINKSLRDSLDSKSPTPSIKIIKKKKTSLDKRNKKKNYKH